MSLTNYLVEALLRHGANAVQAIVLRRATPLHVAEARGHLQIVQALLRAGAVPHQAEAEHQSSSSSSRTCGP